MVKRVIKIDIDKQLDEYEKDLVNLHDYLEKNKRDRQEYVETLQDIENKQSEIGTYNKLKKIFKNSKSDYMTGVQNLRKMEKMRDDLQNQLDALEDKLDACAISMDSSVYDSNQCMDYAEEAKKYEKDKAQITEMLLQINELISAYTNKR